MPCSGEQQRQQRLQRLQRLQQQLAAVQRSPQPQPRWPGSGTAGTPVKAARCERSDLGAEHAGPRACLSAGTDGSAVMRKAAATAERYRAFLAATATGVNPHSQPTPADGHSSADASNR